MSGCLLVLATQQIESTSTIAMARIDLYDKLLVMRLCALVRRLDLPWWEKLVGASFKTGRFQLKQLAGGKMDDITVLVSLVA